MNDDPVADFRRALDALLGRAETLLRNRLGRTFAWPMRTADLFTLASALGYIVDIQAVDRAFAQGGVKRPKKVGRDLVWTRSKALNLLMRLERLRAWSPEAPLHIHKMTCYERAAGAKAIAKLTAPFAAGVRARPDYPDLSPKALIAEAVDAENAPLRRWAIHCLRKRLSIVDDPSDVLVAESLRKIAEAPDAEQRGELGAVLLRWVNGLQAEPITLGAVGLDDMIAGLRADDMAARFKSAMRLAQSFGAGAKRGGFDENEVELGAGKDVSDLLAKAIAGDSAAVDQLAGSLTAEYSEASETPVELNAEAIQLADTGAMELLDELDRGDLSDDRRRTLVEALAIAAGGRSSGGAARDELCGLLDGVLDGDAEAIASARQWVVENIIALTGGE